MEVGGAQSSKLDDSGSREEDEIVEMRGIPRFFTC